MAVYTHCCRAQPLRQLGFLVLFDLKMMEYFRDVFKLDLAEETRTQLQEEEAIASSYLILATPMRTFVDGA